MKMYHASNHEFEFPDYQNLIKNISGHSNGHLGLWVSVEHDWIRGFGPHLYEIEFDGTAIELSVSELQNLCTDPNCRPGASSNSEYLARQFFINTRAKWLDEKIDYMRLIEQDGVSAMGVIVNFNCIISFKKYVHESKTVV